MCRVKQNLECESESIQEAAHRPFMQAGMQIIQKCPRAVAFGLHLQHQVRMRCAKAEATNGTSEAEMATWTLGFSACYVRTALNACNVGFRHVGSTTK